MKRDQKLRADKILIKNTQRHRLRAEVYAINAYLKSVEQQRYDEMIKAKFRGETNRTEITYDSDSSGSHESEDSDSAGRQNQQGNSEKKSVAGAPKANNPSRSYGV